MQAGDQLTLRAQKMQDSAMHACPDSSRKLRRKMSRCQSTCRKQRVSLIKSIHRTNWRFGEYRGSGRS